MRTIGSLAITAMLALASGCGGKSVDLAAEEAAVRATYDELGTAFSSKDWDHYSELFVHEPYLQVVHPGLRDWITGWSSFEDRYKELMTSEFDWAFETNRMEVQVSPTGETAWAIGELVLTSDGQSEISWQIAVFQKIGGAWRIAAAFASSLPSDK